VWKRREPRAASAGVRQALSGQFELGWLGGATADRLHRRRSGSEELPWGTLDLAAIAPDIAAEARMVWTNGVFTEYASAAAFSSLTTALLECGAPVDLVAFSADVVVDELFHVELCARLTTELGGAAPLHFDLAKISPRTSPGSRPLMRAAEIAVTTACVGESLSVVAMARSRALATAPLVRAVLDRLLADEGPHARVGWLFLDWASEHLDEAERARLATLAMSAIETYAPLWRESECDRCPIPIGLGGHDAQGRESLRRAALEKIARPLAEHGIVLEERRLQLVTSGARSGS